MKHLCLLATAAVVYDDSGSAAEWLTVSQGLSDETDFSALSDPGFAQALKELEIISDAENITRQEMEEIAAMTGRLDVVNSNPTSLHGIEYFESPTGANCALNELLSLDVSKNTKPYQLYCEDNPGNGSTFRVTVWDDFNRNNIPSGFTKEGWEYGGQTIAPSTRKQSNPGLGTRRNPIPVSVAFFCADFRFSIRFSAEIPIFASENSARHEGFCSHRL